MSTNIQSDKVSFFPSAIIRQGENVVKSHRIVDTALKKWISSLVDVAEKAFVISYNSSQDKLVCYFDGVVVTITDPTSYVHSEAENVYVTAHMNSEGGLWGEDLPVDHDDDAATPDIYHFTGIVLSDQSNTEPIATTSSGTYTDSITLHALEKVDGDWLVPVKSLHKFTSASIENIDGGEV